ncbi:ATP-dependent DNA helicase [Neobacillus sp. NPDC093127]|uniref:ATP-dependent DNA helicase n=1 Tax=Neobacillus sp. NPDC093127 TaxID=3364296 RepID=UPI003827DB0B
MRILLMLMTLFVIGTFSVHAEPFISEKVENIDLKLKEDEAAVSFLGLTKGEAILLQGPNDKNILVNAGGKGSKAELEAWLSLYGVKEISALILTNNGQEQSFDKLNQLIAKYNIKEIITTREISNQLTGNLEQIKQISILPWGSGAKKEILPQMTAEVQFSGHEKEEGMDLTLQFFKHTIFLMSSCSHQSEQILLKKNLKDVNIFKLPLYTKEDSLSGKLIEYLNPQIAILFTEEKQKLDRDILDDLHDTWSEIYLTKKQAATTIKLTKTNYEVITIPIIPEE